jgi:hypothetical protein
VHCTLQKYALVNVVELHGLDGFICLRQCVLRNTNLKKSANLSTFPLQAKADGAPGLTVMAAVRVVLP